ncbi:ras-related protein Rab-27B-like [Octopus vulgaris]|uniref:Ras-related protein Rab-27B-like n=1 Tax=Octopus vulgaris TaxID=6645 RepID=A0AA36EYU6_OCTVU|nr:ras-related protein Rab-27B-like [Octopus vulgaris]
MSKYFLKWKQRLRNENDVSKEDIFQFIVIGDASVGKTTWINHFFSGYTSRTFAPTIGIDFRCKRMNYRIVQTLPNGQSKVYYRQASVQIWDTAGMERFRALTLSYFRQARGFLLMVDLTNENTFVNAFDWLQKVEELAPVTGYDIIILANKCDLRSFKDVNDITLEEFAIKNSNYYSVYVPEIGYLPYSGGDASVGKSSFLNQYIEGKAPSTFIPTIGIDFRNKKLSYKYSYSNAQGSVAVAYHKVCVQLWDTAGMERFHSLTTSYFRDAKGFFLMIDLTNENTFVNAFAWLQKMEEYGPRSGYDVIIVGNKIDLVDRRKISAETLHKFAENHRLRQQYRFTVTILVLIVAIPYPEENCD